MKNVAEHYGWTPRTSGRKMTIANQYGWTQPFHDTQDEVSCTECGKSYQPSQTGAMYECDHCINSSIE